MFSDVATWLFSPMQKDTVALPAPPSSTGPLGRMMRGEVGSGSVEIFRAWDDEI